MSHVIAAVSTGNQISAIGILRLTGDGCAQMAGKVFTCVSGKPLWEAPNRKLMLGQLQDAQGRVIDQCMAVYTRAPPLLHRRGHCGNPVSRQSCRAGCRSGRALPGRCKARQAR